MKRLGLKTVSFYLFTTLLAIFTGLILVTLVQPGAGIDLSDEIDAPALQSKTLGEALFACLPRNPFGDLAAGQMLPIVVFAIIFGIFLARARNESDEPSLGLPDDPHTFSGRAADSSVETLIHCFRAGFDVMMKMTIFIVKFAPLGVFGLIATNIARFSGEGGAFAQFGQGHRGAFSLLGHFHAA